MPDHLHCLIFWEVDENPKLTISKIVQSFKSHCAKEILYYLETGERKSSLSPYSKDAMNTGGASEGSHLPSMGSVNSIGNINNLDSINNLDNINNLGSINSLGSWKPSLPVRYKWENTGEVHTVPKTKFWQKGFHDFNIYTEKKLKEKFDYIHITNPIKAGLCTKPEDYRWSSYRQIMGIEKKPVLRVDVL